MTTKFNHPFIEFLKRQPDSAYKRLWLNEDLLKKLVIMALEGTKDEISVRKIHGGQWTEVSWVESGEGYFAAINVKWATVKGETIPEKVAHVLGLSHAETIDLFNFYIDGIMPTMELNPEKKLYPAPFEYEVPKLDDFQSGYVVPIVVFVEEENRWYIQMGFFHRHTNYEGVSKEVNRAGAGNPLYTNPKVVFQTTARVDCNTARNGALVKGGILMLPKVTSVTELEQDFIPLRDAIRQMTESQGSLPLLQAIAEGWIWIF